jgi:ankyrin repeat protein
MRIRPAFTCLLITLCTCCQRHEKSEPGSLAKDSVEETSTPPTPGPVQNARAPHKTNSVQDSLLDAITWVGDSALISALVSRGADVNLRDNNMFYPLYWAQYAYHDSYYPHKKDSSVIKTLIRHGAIDYNAQLFNLFAACRNGNLDSVKALIDNGMDVNAKRVWYDPPEEDASCNCYETPIVAAVQSGNMELVNFLLERGAQINPDKNGAQPVAVALQKENYAMSDLLIRKGAAKHFTFALDYPFYYYAPSDTVYLDYLIANHFPYETFYDYESPLQIAVRNSDFASLRRLIPIAPMQELNASFCYATNQRTAELLIRRNAEINSVAFDVEEGGCHNFSTPLLSAVQAGNLGYVKFLVSKGADVNFLDSYMKEYKEIESSLRCSVASPLTLAVQEGKTDLVHYLITAGANVNFIILQRYEDKPISPLIVAVEKNSVELTKLLLTKGATFLNDGVSINDYVTPATPSEIVTLLKTKRF